MSSLATQLDACRAQNRPAVVGYLPVGFPDVEGSIEAMRALVESGVDIVEVGLPYTDPLMDGPVIQTAATRALESGVRVRDVFRAVKAIDEAGAAAVVMTYWNPVLRYGVDEFAHDLAAAGGSGMITPDLVPDEAAPWMSASEEHGLDRVFLVAPSSTAERLASTTAASSGFVYAASLMGVTGARTAVDDAAELLVSRVREVSDLPVCVGLGVSTRDQVAQIGRYADGVIIGSALVRCLVDADTPADGLRALRHVASELVAGAHESRR
ncbi:tryptophan synthase subunit alpha [Demetria terragena]|uniref:tryptophan synthase subunit alpha n=1 Tax=Demetria terragena TaxID=63959 RepID=UPI00037F0682|nr:tryptophan synthase subunit alpha [Demetria terragena]